jgi:MFS family permease
VLSVQLLASSATRVGIYTLAGDKAPQDGQALFMNRFSTFNDLGTALGPLVAFSIYASFGFGWVAALAILLLCGVIGILLK